MSRRTTEDGSAAFKQTLLARRAVLAEERASAGDQLDDLKRTVAQLDADIGHIDALLGDAPGASEEVVTVQSSVGSGEERAADLVVALLGEKGRPLHYREIERELRARGDIAVEGKDPANILLSRYYNDERLYRPKRGTYALRNGRNVRSVGARRTRRGK
ncbi:MAG: HTH domain-containing protein [Chloroflexota bacterium]|nr:HTH domain-containing protein [Chloroflexota bacterium]